MGSSLCLDLLRRDSDVLGLTVTNRMVYNGIEIPSPNGDHYDRLERSRCPKDETVSSTLRFRRVNSGSLLGGTVP